MFSKPGLSKIGQSLSTRILGAAAALSAFAVIATLICFGLFGLRINTTPSMPLGIYRTSTDSSATIIAFCPAGESSRISMTRQYRPPGSCTDGGAPLLKNIVAFPGDEVAIGPDGIAINSKLLPNTRPIAKDTASRPLTAWPPGRYIVPPGYLWVASTTNARSYDSRYYGPIQTSQIKYRLKSVFISAH